ncbi:MAG: ABC transporter substrate-binding protein, partial [Deltaproteobacteria bacterium]
MFDRLVVNLAGRRKRHLTVHRQSKHLRVVGGFFVEHIEFILKGTRIGVASLTGGATSILVSYLKTKGLQHPRDFNMVIISGGTPARLTALESGAIAAGILGIPFGDMAIDRGLNKLGDTTEVISHYQFNAVNVSPAWAERNRSTVVKFIKAHIRSLRWIYESPDQTADFLAKELGVKPPYGKVGAEYYIRN